MNKIRGQHLVIDAYGIAPEKLKDRQLIKNLLENLPIKFRMRILGRAVVRKIQTPGYPEWGFSGFVILYESHVSIHTWPEEGYVAMDIYSCKDFDHKKIVAYLKNFWRARLFKTRVISRG